MESNIVKSEKFFEPSLNPLTLHEQTPEKVGFRKKLTKLCKGGESVGIWTITPEMAAVMLERNPPNNRTLRKGNLDAYSRHMKGDKWLLTNQGIGFDFSGRLVDGQHRLVACEKDKSPFRSIVAFGLSPDTFAVVDGGHRSLVDKAHIDKMPFPRLTAPASRTILQYDLCKIFLPTGSNQPKGIRTVNNEKIDDLLCLDFMRETPEFLVLVDDPDNRKMWSSFPAVSKPLLVASHFILKRVHPELADHFMHQLCYGENLKKSDNVYLLRKVQLDMSIQNIEKKAWRFAWIIDCFNDIRRGKITKYVEVKGRDFPKVLS